MIRQGTRQRSICRQPRGWRTRRSIIGAGRTTRGDDLAGAAERLRAVLDVSRALASLDDETEVLQIIASSACAMLDYGACVVAVRGDDGAFWYRATAGCTPRVDRELRTLSMTPEAFEVLRDAATALGSVLYVPAGHPVRTHPALANCFIATEASVPSSDWRSGSLLLVPLIGFGGEVLGFLNPDDPLDGGLPTRGQIAVLETFAHQAVVALQIVQGRAAERERAQWAEAQRRQLEGLLQASASVRGSLRLDEVLSQIAIAMTSAGGFGGAAIYLLDADTDMLHVRATVGLSDDEDKRLRATPVPFETFAHLMRPEMRLSRSYLFDHRKHSIPAHTNAALSTPPVDPDWQDGQWHAEDSLTVPIEDREGRYIGLISVDEPHDRAFPDLARIQALELFADHCVVAVEQARLYEEMHHLAMTDGLTGLPSRTLFNDRLRQALATAQRERDHLALLLMDLDRFKEVNDTLGHHCGDLLLHEVGSRVRGALRASDTVARLGGDEFALILPGADAAGAMGVAAGILSAFDAPMMIEGHAVDIGASIGIALFPAHGADAAALMRQADVAMYVAKRTGSGHALYSEEQDQHSPYRLALMTALRQSLTDDALELHYQPLVDVRRARVVGVEALVRWRYPGQEFIPPDQFIPLAEHTGVIAPLTRWVLETALRRCRALHCAGFDLGVSVNLSARTLHDPGLPETVRHVLRDCDVAPRRLTLEITESALMTDPARALEALTLLAEMGVRVSIDDFGTGYSSLGYLKRLPVHEVKIDKSFVAGMGAGSGDADAAIVRSVVAMSHALNLDVVAEGIETAATWAMLAALGCDTGQGYYVSRPLPGAALDQWLRDSPWSREEATA